MNKAVKESLFAYDGSVIWLYRGTEVCVGNQRQFNALLSDVCNDIYSLTPSINNELINRQKLSGNISAARVKYLQAQTVISWILDLKQTSSHRRRLYIALC